VSLARIIARQIHQWTSDEITTLR